MSADSFYKFTAIAGLILIFAGPSNYVLFSRELQLKIIEFETDKKIIEEELHQLDTNLSTLQGLAKKESTINEKLRALIGKLKESVARKEAVCGKDVLSLEKKYAEMEEFYATQLKEYEHKRKELDKA
jgi:cupin superfamily acireductone dioxygenase involved in methionine salvage